ncbi:MAG: D-glycero-beta-D-manno-heptose 1,7-bisphosphate 7-phosphatase [Gammaproteobacteria bacterium]
MIILDRDGVINEDSPHFIKNPAEWHPIPGSLEAIAALNRAGHQVVVATNQSGIGRGLFTEADLQQIHDKMQRALAEVGGHLDGIFYCPHHPDAGCDCRKPKPGLLHQIVAQFNIDLRQAVLIGDDERDIVCAQAVECPAILVTTGKGKNHVEKAASWNHVRVFKNLAEAAHEFI